MLTITRYRSADTFLAVAEPMLMLAEAENNLIIGVARGIARNPSAVRDPYLAAVSDGDRLLACAVHITPYKIVITSADQEPIVELARDAFEAVPQIDAVTGPERSATHFALAWSTLSGVGAVPGMRLRIHETRSAQDAAAVNVPGRFRMAGNPDLPLLVAWMDAFVEEANMTEPVDSARIIGDAIGRGRLFVWDDGEPAAMAAWAGKTPNGVRINLVYTPPARRRKGYGSACVQAMTAHLLAEGNAFCWLYTDLASETSTSLFTRLGYQPVSDVAEYYLKGQSTVASHV